jgi:hypothetical protein
MTPGSTFPSRVVACYIPLQEGSASALPEMERAMWPALGPPWPGLLTIWSSTFHLEIIDALLVELYWNKLGQSKLLIKLIIEEDET